MLLKKGAMFGLDARIALIVFTLVGLIATGFIYGFLKESNVKTIVYEARQIETVIGAYEADTETDFPFFSGSVYSLGELVDSSVAGWLGPYLNYSLVSGADAKKYLVSKRYGRIAAFRATARSASDVTDSPYNNCNGTQDCYLWFMYENSADGSLNQVYMQLLDKELDGGDGFLTGRVQKYNADDLLLRMGQVEFY